MNKILKFLHEIMIFIHIVRLIENILEKDVLSILVIGITTNVIFMCYFILFINNKGE